MAGIITTEEMPICKMDNENWQAWINIFKGADGNMQFEKQAFGTWPSTSKKDHV